MTEYKECAGCHKPYPVETVFKKISMVLELNHGTTKESQRMEFCPKCQKILEETWESLGKEK